MIGTYNVAIFNISGQLENKIITKNTIFNEIVHGM